MAESAMAPGAKTGSVDTTRKEERRQAPRLGEVVPIDSLQPAETAGAGAPPLRPRPPAVPLVVPFACHIEGSIPVPSGQPRSISLAP